MRLKDHERTSAALLQVRVMRCLQDAGEALTSTATLGAAGWPSNNLKAQGLAFAIGPTLGKLRKQGLIAWTARGEKGNQTWGWLLTPKGRDVALTLKSE